MNTTEGSCQNLDDKSEEFASCLEKVLEKFEEIGIEKYFKLRDDAFYKSFVKVKGNFTDTFSVMNGCIDKLKIAVKELDNVCTKFTKSISEKGLFSVSNIYLKKISKDAKAFYRDLDRLETRVESRDTCQKNFDKFSKSSENLKCDLISSVNSEIKTLRRPPKIQNVKVKNLMCRIASQINSFYNIYDDRYKDLCFKE